MLDSIKSFFESRLATDEEQQEHHLLPAADLASAALLIEVMRSDDQLDDRESAEFLRVLQECLGISRDDLEKLQKLAEEENRQATSLYEFTRLINDNYDYEQKCTLIENMWHIAFSDEKLDKYEDHLIRRIAELIHVSHSDFIRLKLKARDKGSSE